MSTFSRYVFGVVSVGALASAASVACSRSAARASADPATAAPGQTRLESAITKLAGSVDAFSKAARGPTPDFESCARIAEQIAIDAKDARSAMVSGDAGALRSVDPRSFERLAKGASVAAIGAKSRDPSTLYDAAALIDAATDQLKVTQGSPSVRHWAYDVAFADDDACPAGFWAFDAGSHPGQDEFERHDQEAKRAKTAETAATRTYLLKLPKFDLEEYDFSTGSFPVTVASRFSCSTSDQRAPVTIDAPALSHRRYALKVPPAQARELREHANELPALKFMGVRAVTAELLVRLTAPNRGAAHLTADVVAARIRDLDTVFALDSRETEPPRPRRARRPAASDDVLVLPGL